MPSPHTPSPRDPFDTPTDGASVDAPIRTYLLDGRQGENATASERPSVPDVLLDAAFWSDWRVEVAFFLCRMVYALSALPFVLFHFPGVRTLLSHTFATGFTPHGACVRATTTPFHTYH
jgi:hypothetical protein